MALIFENSICTFCGEPLNDGRPYDGLPELFPDGHKFAICSDTGFHNECFEKWDHYKEVKSIYTEFLLLQKSRPEIPEGMPFNEFEKTEAYKSHMDKFDKLLTK